MVKSEDFSAKSPNNKFLKQSDENNKGKVKFAWSKFPQAKGYKLEVSRNENFEELITQKSTTDRNHEETYDEGLYYWRVKANTSLSPQPISTATYSFAVGKAASYQAYVDALNAPAPVVPEPPPKEEPIVKKPKYVNPYAKASLKLDTVQNIVKKFTPNQKGKTSKIKLSWSKSLSDSMVGVKLSQNKNFKKIQNTKDNKFRYRVYPC